jgi:hypothetical protein
MTNTCERPFSSCYCPPKFWFTAPTIQELRTADPV